MRTLSLIAVFFATLVVYSPHCALAQGGPAAERSTQPQSTQFQPAQPQPQEIPPTEISADLGPCSALITVTGADSKPVYNAKVTARIRYGAFGVKRLDLETFTSAAGQVKIVKLPEHPNKPVTIYISKDDKMETVEFQPEVLCRATFDVHLK